MTTETIRCESRLREGLEATPENLDLPTRGASGGGLREDLRGEGFDHEGETPGPKSLFGK